MPPPMDEGLKLNMTVQAPAQVRIRIWDLPTRLFHIFFACCVAGAILTAKLGNTWMDWHVKLGIAALALLIFRLIWGLIGPRYARFSQFVCGPISVWRYLTTLTKQTKKIPGHNPWWLISGCNAFYHWGSGCNRTLCE